MLISNSDASAILGTVARIVLRRNAPREMMSLAEMEAPRDAIALDVACAIMSLVFANASVDTTVTGANIRPFSAEEESYFWHFH